MKNSSKFAPANIHADSVIGKRARLHYLAQSGTHGNGKSNMSGAGDKRTLGERLYQMG